MIEEKPVIDNTFAGNDTASIFREAYFPTLIFYQDLKDSDALNSRLSSKIWAEREADNAGIVRSNEPRLGGWHSKNELHLEPELDVLVQHIKKFSSEVETSLAYDPAWPLEIDNMWSIINPPGSHNHAHIHPNSLWSGVYYVQAPPAAGRIKFTDPRTQQLMQSARYDPNVETGADAWHDVFFEPKPGRILLFPSWLYHSVEPNLSDLVGKAADRIIVSFNLYQKRI